MRTKVDAVVDAVYKNKHSCRFSHIGSLIASRPVSFGPTRERHAIDVGATEKFHTYEI